MRLGERVLFLRRNRGESQQQLGKAVGLTPVTISRLERGSIEDLRGVHLAALAEHFGCSVDYLLGLSTMEPHTNGLKDAPAHVRGD